MRTFFWHWQLAALDDFHCLLWFVAGSFGDILDLLYDFITLQNLAEYDVLAIKPATKVNILSWQKEQ